IEHPAKLQRSRKLLLFLYKYVYAPGALFGPIAYFIVPRDKMQYPLYSLVFKVFVKIFGPSAEHEINFYFIPNIKKFSYFFGLHLQIMLRCIEAYPYFSNLRRARLFIRLPALFFLLV